MIVILTFIMSFKSNGYKVVILHEIFNSFNQATWHLLHMSQKPLYMNHNLTVSVIKKNYHTGVIIIPIRKLINVGDLLLHIIISSNFISIGKISHNRLQNAQQILIYIYT